MIAFATYSDLKKIAAQVDTRKILAETYTLDYEKNLFLSHSSKDHELVPGAVLLLEYNGGKVYVDDMDPGLTEADPANAAERIRGILNQCRKFVLLVTRNSKDSHWIPWELGISDGTNKGTNVALLPIAETSFDQQWSQQEYLGLYSRIIWGNFSGEDQPQWLVYDYRTNQAVKLRQWIAQ